MLPALDRTARDAAYLTLGLLTSILAFSVWVVYAIVLHAPINPSFRGRKVAVLSIFGFLLMIGTLIAVNFVPADGGSH